MHDLATPLPGQPHDLPHGVAMEILEAQHGLEAVRAMLGHVRLETTQMGEIAACRAFDRFRTAR